MKSMTYSQQQLLKTLQITPLQLNAAFESKPVADSNPEIPAKADTELLQAVELNSALVQDILLALPTGFSWQISQSLSGSQLSHKQLISPELAHLQSAEAKKALWHLLSSVDAD